MYSFVNNLPEYGLQEPKHVAGASQNNKYLWLNVQLVGINRVRNNDNVNSHKNCYGRLAYIYGAEGEWKH
jgi:hypothetical protein